MSTSALYMRVLFVRVFTVAYLKGFSADVYACLVCMQQLIAPNVFRETEVTLHPQPWTCKLLAWNVTTLTEHVRNTAEHESITCRFSNLF